MSDSVHPDRPPERLSDSPSDRPRTVKNPPRGARSRAPRAPDDPAATAPPSAGAPEAPAPADAGGRRQRSIVCPNCGKYFDITHRPVGATFDCKCGATLTVPAPADRPPDYRPPEVTLRLRELRTRHAWSIVAAVLGFAGAIALAAATVHLLVTRGLYMNGACAALAAVAFLAVGVIGVTEMRRAKAEIAAGEAGR